MYDEHRYNKLSEHWKSFESFFLSQPEHFTSISRVNTVLAFRVYGIFFTKPVRIKSNIHITKCVTYV